MLVSESLRWFCEPEEKKNADVTNAFPKLIHMPNFIQIEQWESVQIPRDFFLNYMLDRFELSSQYGSRKLFLAKLDTGKSTC